MSASVYKMKFEEMFPSLKGLHILFPDQESLQEHCLDKQKVKEAIKKCKNWKPVNLLPIEILWKLERELGLKHLTTLTAANCHKAKVRGLVMEEVKKDGG